MSNAFSALAPFAEDLKKKARERDEQQIKADRVQQKIARETEEFLQTMHKTGVKSSGGVRLHSSIEEKDIDFAGAMRAAGVEPLGHAPRVQHKKRVSTEPRQTKADEEAVLQEAMSDKADSIEFLESEDGLSFRRPEVGPDVPRDLRRGRWAVVGQIDLHGMFVEEAREAVGKFLRNAQMNERLCLRIIHGKGNSNPDRQSVLREKVRRWLKQRDEVIAFAQPYERDGGAGATLVRIKPLSRRKGG